MRHPIRPLQYGFTFIQANQRRPANAAAQGYGLAADHGHRPATLWHQYRLQTQASACFPGSRSSTVVDRRQPGRRRARRICLLRESRRSANKEKQRNEPHRVNHALSELRV